MTEERFDKHDRCAQIGDRDIKLYLTLRKSQGLSLDLCHSLLLIHHWKRQIAKSKNKMYNLKHILGPRFFDQIKGTSMKWDTSEISTKQKIVGTFTYKVKGSKKITRKYTFE